MNKRPDDDLHYEDFDDVQRPGDDELAPIDLDALDDEIETAEPDIVSDKLAALDLDALDDEIEPVEPEVTTGPILEMISELENEIEVTSAEKVAEPTPEIVEKPQRKRKRAAKIKVEETPPAEEAPEKVAEEPIAEVVAEVTSQEAAATEATPAVPALIYRVMIPLPDELAGTVIDLRKTGEITEMPPPGIELAAAFHTGDLGPVQEALSVWARNHLPLQLETTAVLAEVIGSRQYVAAWMLQPEEELHDAQRDLMRTLEPLINPLPDVPAAFHVQVTIGDHVMPKPFPHLIGEMQRDFEPFVWDAETVSLVQFTPGPAAVNWEPVESFR